LVKQPPVKGFVTRQILVRHWRSSQILVTFSQRVNGEAITDRPVWLWDRDARPIRRARSASPTNSGTNH
jgi:hypothetical protein